MIKSRPFVLPLLTALAILWALQAGCGPSIVVPNLLHVVRGFVPPYQPQASFHPDSFDVIVRDTRLVEDTYQQTLALPKRPKGVCNGAVRYGYRYQLTFWHNSKRVLTATTDLYGCEIIF